MLIKELGEFGLINRFSSRFLNHLPPSVEGIGDDCAVIPHEKGFSLLITTDLLIENVHFLRSKISAYELGQKALAVNLSDIAAMGGTPLYAFLSIGLPSDIQIDWIDSFFQGIHDLAKQENVHLLGGDTTGAKDITINFAVIGKAKNKQIKRRSQAKPGDIICCTGYLGDSGGGLRVLLNHLPHTPITKYFVDQHQRPRAHTQEGLWLGSKSAVRAMIDVSDGIDSDLRHILSQSKCGATINVENLPLSPLLEREAQTFGWNPIELATSAGEDYCLLLTMNPKQFKKINQEYQKLFGKPLYKIGQITNDANQLIYLKEGCPMTISRTGFDHFKK